MKVFFTIKILEMGVFFLVKNLNFIFRAWEYKVNACNENDPPPPPPGPRWLLIDRASFPSVAGTETAKCKTLVHTNLT